MNYLEFDIGIARLTEYDPNKFPTVQVDNYGEEKSGVAPYEIHSPHGLISRCRDPEVDPGGTSTLGCAVLYALDGGQGHAWLQSDPRVIPNLPPIKKGGTCTYGGTIKNPSFYNIDGEKGSQTIYVPYKIVNDVAEKSMTIAIDVEEEGKEAISIIHGSGAAIFIVENDGEVSITLKNKDGTAYLEVNNEGTTVNGPLVVNGSFNGGGPVGALPVAMGLPTAVALAALQAQLVAVATALTALAGVGALAGVAAALGTAAGSISSGTSTVSGAAALVPARNTSGV